MDYEDMNIFPWDDLDDFDWEDYDTYWPPEVDDFIEIYEPLDDIDDELDFNVDDIFF